jgi:hypothetical protein
MDLQFGFQFKWFCGRFGAKAKLIVLKHFAALADTRREALQPSNRCRWARLA